MDLSHIRNVAAGDEKFIRQLLTKISIQLEQDFNALEHAVIEDDFEEVSQKAHKIKSTANLLKERALVEQLLQKIKSHLKYGSGSEGLSSPSTPP